MNLFHNKRYGIALLPTIFVMGIFLLVFSCTKQTKDDSTAKPVGGNGEAGLSEEYKKEGFLTPDLYRIVIVTPKEEKADMVTMEEKARTRALMSLRGYLTSRSKSLTPNMNAQMLLLIKENGSFAKAGDKHPTRNVYLFEIKKKGLKTYMDNL